MGAPAPYFFMEKRERAEKFLKKNNYIPQRLFADLSGYVKNRITAGAMLHNVEPINVYICLLSIEIAKKMEG